MNRKLRTVLYRPALMAGVFVGSCALVFLLPARSPASAAVPAELKAAIDAKSKELTEVHEKIKETEANLASLETKSKTLNSEIKKYDYQIQQLNLGITSSSIRIEQLNLEMNSLEFTIADTEANIAAKRAAIAAFLRRLHERSRESILLVFLKNMSLADSMLEASSLAQLNHAIATEVAELESTNQTLAATLALTEEKKESLEVEKGSLETKKAISHEQKKGRQTLLSATKNQEQAYATQLAELEKLQAQIGEEIANIEGELRAAFDPNLLPVPRPGVFQQPVIGSITQPYGGTAFAQKAYKSKFHNGVDYSAPLGTPVVAALDGVVTAVGNNGKYQYGKYVLIEHANGMTTLYAHLSKHGATPAKAVTAGEVIGYIGNTGYSFGNHLHFTVYWSQSVLLKDFPTCTCGLVPVGVTVNPLDYI